MSIWQLPEGQIISGRWWYRVLVLDQVTDADGELRLIKHEAWKSDEDKARELATEWVNDLVGTRLIVEIEMYEFCSAEVLTPSS